MKIQYEEFSISSLIYTILALIGYSVGASCPIPKIKNGTFRMQRAGRMGYFYCATGFELHGAMSILCNSGRWKQDIPICIKSGCKSLPKQKNGWVMTDEKKQKSMIFCQDGYSIAGSSVAFCDGVNWDRELGECRLDVNHTKLCDFETSSMCGFTQDDDNDFNWVRRNGWNSYERLEFGPNHDHTKGKPLEGYYMVAEATNSRPTKISRLLSPVHNQNDSENACFRFYYHMYGRNVGRLRVIIKNIDEDMDEIVNNPRNILFEIQNNQGNQWNEAFFQVERQNKDFQIIFEATGSKGPISDIAIDDVALLNGGDCVKLLKLDVVTEEENGGIYDIMSCAGRCMETESVRNSGNKTLIQDNRIVEKCDCHPECYDLKTCCLDYVTICDTTTEDSTTEMTSVVQSKKTTPLFNTTIVTTQTPKSTPRSTVIVTVSNVTAKLISASTSTTNVPTLATATVKSILNSTTVASTTSNFNKNSTVNKFIVTKNPFSKNISALFTEVTRLPSKSSNKSTLSVKITTILPKRYSKTTETISKVLNGTTPKIIETTTSIPLIIKSTQKIAPTHPTTVKKLEIFKLPHVSNKEITYKTTDKMVITSNTAFSRNQFAWITIVILICVLSMLMLFGWKNLISNHRWNQFNSNPIEYKSNSCENDGLLVESNSFIIDDTFIDNKENTSGSAQDFKAKSQSKSGNVLTERTTTSSHFDKFSERRILTNDDDDDDQLIDFTMQTNK